MKFYKKGYLIIILLININSSILQKTIKVVRPIIKDHYNDAKANPIDYFKYALKKIYLSKPFWIVSAYTHYHLFNKGYDKFKEYNNKRIMFNISRQYPMGHPNTQRLINNIKSKIKKEESSTFDFKKYEIPLSNKYNTK
jgi:hypothetical protein